ncbi:Hypothetical predicted protein [Mytilus galloprovincialis]|uniref:Mitochondria-eating protein C-terminal domain-containing protein n=1 Tax=Mytilus galloprovincialis TaxID=29158 RepID=A0A8B6DMH2_MYTGA|nr:Hypothetical predicted protein [Mytilus galloprovincialis]
MYKSHLIVVAVNIGETYSGYTFSTKYDFQQYPRNVKCYGKWKSQYLERLNTQTPTSILLNAEKGFESFGFEAEDQYLSLSAENMNKSDVYFFQHFLSQDNWYREKSGQMFVKPSNRNGCVPLKTLLKHSVSYLKTHFLCAAKICEVFKQNEILWVVVYPDKIKFDVRFILLETFLNTGISRENIILLGESRAIKTFTRHIEETKGVSKDRTIILNCTLTQLYPNTSFQMYSNVPTNVIGLSSVINDVDSILKKRLGCSLFSDMTDNHSRCDLMTELEMSLKGENSNQFYRFRLPIYCIEIINEHITNSWKKGFELFQDKLKIDKTTIHEVFQNVLKPLVDHWEKEINILNRETIQRVILVGDFSGFGMTKTVIQESFPQYEFIVPSNSEMVATIGGTIAGHEIRSGKYDSCILYVPKMPVDGTSHIESKLLSKPAGLNNSFSEKPSFKPNIDTASVKENISNLSFLPDPIRPSKIATKLQDLYEIEYPESLVFYLEKGCDDVTSSGLLLKILQEIYDACRNRAQIQMSTTTQAFHPTVRIGDSKTSLPSDVVMPLLEYRRKNALQYLPRLIKSFVETFPSKINMSNEQLSACTSFIEKGMECCWLMSVTEPPMFLKFKWNKGNKIDLDELEVERGKGKYVESILWPALYLYENGPLMNKGVVNAK